MKPYTADQKLMLSAEASREAERENNAPEIRSRLGWKGLLVGGLFSEKHLPHKSNELPVLQHLEW